MEHAIPKAIKHTNLAGRGCVFPTSGINVKRGKTDLYSDTYMAILLYPYMSSEL